MNKWLQKLHDLESGREPPKQEMGVLQAPSKPSKPSFEGFEGGQSTPISRNSELGRAIEPCQNRMAENAKSPSFDNRQNPQNPYNRVMGALLERCPAHVEPDRWQQAAADAESFLPQWGEQAEGLGWSSADLFGLHPVPDKPHPSYRRLSRYDCTGLLWLLEGRAVTMLSSESAVILNPKTGNATKYRKERKPAYGP